MLTLESIDESRSKRRKIATVSIFTTLPIDVIKTLDDYVPGCCEILSQTNRCMYKTIPEKEQMQLPSCRRKRGNIAIEWARIYGQSLELLEWMDPPINDTVCFGLMGAGHDDVLQQCVFTKRLIPGEHHWSFTNCTNDDHHYRQILQECESGSSNGCIELMQQHGHSIVKWMWFMHCLSENAKYNEYNPSPYVIMKYAYIAKLFDSVQWLTDIQRSHPTWSIRGMGYLPQAVNAEGGHPATHEIQNQPPIKTNGI